MRAAAAPAILLSGVSSDAHTWNLVFLELLLREHGCRVVNLGACVPGGLLVRACLLEQPDALVLSSVNGHGASDGERAVRALRAVPALARLPVLIGGNLGTRGETGAAERRKRLIHAGFDEVFEGADSLPLFLDRLKATLPVSRSVASPGQAGGTR